MRNAQPTWQPISMLPTFADLINERLEHTLGQLKNYKQAEHQPHIFDDETINRALKLYGEQLETHWLFEKQVGLWGNQELSGEQRAELVNLEGQLQKLKEAYGAILALVDKMRDHTIDNMMAMNDFELGLKSLMGEMPGTFRK